MRKSRSEPPPPIEKLPFNTIAVKVGAGIWCFETEGFAWKYLEQQGFNLGLHQPNGEYTYQLHFPKLYDAVVYAWGFCYGWKAAIATFKQEMTELRDKAELLKKEYNDQVEVWKTRGK